MGRIGKVIKSFIDSLSGSGTNAQFSSVEEFAGDQRTIQIFGPCNEDFAPPENCRTLDVPLGRDRGFLVAAAYHNQLITPVALPGERRIFSTGEDGTTVKAEVFLKQDGSFIIKNSAATFSVSAAGKVLIETTDEIELKSSKATIDSDLEVTGTISAPVITAATSMSVNSKDIEAHTHSQGNDSDGDAEVNTSGMI